MLSSRAVPSPTAANGFDAAWDEFFSALRGERARAAREIADGDITMSQFQLLAVLADGRSRPVGELAENVGVSAPTVTRMLDGIERAGVAARRQSTLDRRVVEVELTPEGRKIVKRKQRLMAARRSAVYDSLDEGEREQAARLLHRLAEAIREPDA
jgi:DNA-binding MarR family transcriptional regulator